MNKPPFVDVARLLENHGNRQGSDAQLDAYRDLMEKAFDLLTPAQVRRVLAKSDITGMAPLVTLMGDAPDSLPKVLVSLSGEEVQVVCATAKIEVLLVNHNHEAYFSARKNAEENISHPGRPCDDAAFNQAVQLELQGK